MRESRLDCERERDIERESDKRKKSGSEEAKEGMLGRGRRHDRASEIV